MANIRADEKARHSWFRMRPMLYYMCQLELNDKKFNKEYLQRMKLLFPRKRYICEIKNEIYAEWRDNEFLSHEDKMVYLEFFITVKKKKDNIVDIYEFLIDYCTWE